MARGVAKTMTLPPPVVIILLRAFGASANEADGRVSSQPRKPLREPRSNRIQLWREWDDVTRCAGSSKCLALKLVFGAGDVVFVTVCARLRCTGDRDRANGTFSVKVNVTHHNHTYKHGQSASNGASISTQPLIAARPHDVCGSGSATHAPPYAKT